MQAPPHWSIVPEISNADSRSTSAIQEALRSQPSVQGVASLNRLGRFAPLYFLQPHPFLFLQRNRGPFCGKRLMIPAFSKTLCFCIQFFGEKFSSTSERRSRKSNTKLSRIRSN